ncbi:Uncharacterised protein [Vibrio cholerae]|nr:Uncharacterised protein [Vibrio cholerae]
MLVIPFFSELCQSQFRFGQCGCAVNSFKVSGNNLTLFPVNIAQRVTNLMYDTQLHLCFRVNRLDGFREAFQTIAASNEDILYATVLKFVHHRQPELSAFGLSHPQA